MRKKYIETLLLVVMMIMAFQVNAQDPNFYIYLCFGQSNMEGQGTIEIQDQTVDERFQVMQAVDCSNRARVKNQWYDAIPPLTRCYSGLSPADYFGRTMVANLPDSITIGVINVSVAGCKIELFDKENYQSYADGVETWMKNIIASYNENPYQYLVDAAKVAQEKGVVKGILLHQGESNTGDNAWPTKVKGVYENLISDLELNSEEVPLLAGEVVHADQRGICASMNAIIAKLPEYISNAHVISSSGCTDAADNLHFDAAGYRKLGARYAIQMLSLMGIEAVEPEDPNETTGTEAVFLEAECAPVMGENWEVHEDANTSNGNYVSVVPGTESLAAAAGSEGILELPFSIDTTGNFKVYARINCPSPDDDSYWIKMDDGDFQMFNGLGTTGWQWKNLTSYLLSEGEHTLYISYREDGALLDKICITNFSNAPNGMGEEAFNNCDLDSSNVSNSEVYNLEGFMLGDCFPNPTKGAGRFSFYIPEKDYVSVRLIDVRGVVIKELAGKVFTRGEHTLKLTTENLTEGIYFYTLQTGKFVDTKRLIVQ